MDIEKHIQKKEIKMKKVIAILAVMMIAVGVVFADLGDKFKITAIVPKVAPVFRLFGGTAFGSETTAGTATGTTIKTDKDIASEDVVIYLKLTQGKKSKFKGTATLTVTATTLQNGANQTLPPKVSNLEKKSVTGITIADPTGNGTAIASYTLTYEGTTVAEGTELGTMKYTWKHDDKLPPATYEATITLAHIVK
ncbi:MAG: hypothetical protein ACTTJW_07555 [Sphaerochaeta sp.]